MEEDPFLKEFDSSDLKIAEEFLTNWMPFLTRDLCDGCAAAFHDRIRSLNPVHERNPDCSQAEEVDGGAERSDFRGGEGDLDAAASVEGLQEGYEHVGEASCVPDLVHESPKMRLSWADMAQQGELEEEEEEEEVETRRKNSEYTEGVMVDVEPKKTELSREQRERIRFNSLVRKKDFVCLERIDGKMVNILEGLEQHTGVFSAAEQRRIVDFVYELQKQGRNNELGEYSYSEPKKWMRGKGRVTIQFGCCYNYAEKNGIPPGIMRGTLADPIPSLFKVMIKRLIGWHVMPTSCVPDSCIVNIYEPGDCIPPHIDSRDFDRPFCTVSFLSECDILFGSNLRIVSAGEFAGSSSIPLPVGSVLVLNGNGADVAKHCVPAVPSRRISITFRKMNKKKWPFGFRLEPDLQNIRPYDSGSATDSQQENQWKQDSSVERRANNAPRGIEMSADSRAAVGEASGRSHHGYGWANEEGGSSESDAISGERRARSERRGLDAPKDVDRRDGSRSVVEYSARPQVRIRTFKNNQRRVRVNL